MPIATSQQRLLARLALDQLPWPGFKWDTPGLAKAAGVSYQTCYIWSLRRNGPPRKMSRERRASYRVGDFLHWLMGEDSPTGDDRCKAFLAQHMRLATCATGLLRAETGARVRQALTRLDELSGAELEEVCDALDRVRTPWPRAKAAELITTIEGVTAHG